MIGHLAAKAFLAAAVLTLAWVSIGWFVDHSLSQLVVRGSL